MDDNARPQVLYTAPTLWYQKKILWVFALMLILIPAGVYVYGIYFIKPVTLSAPSPVAKNTLEEDSSPIAFNILQNPMVYEWRGSVEGTLISKDDKSITLTNDKGQSITIQIDTSPNGTRFFKPIKDSLKRKSTESYVSLENIPIGTKLTGEFWVFLHQKNIMKGGSFTIIEP